MATSCFKSDSPYNKREERGHHPSDVKYGMFLDQVQGRSGGCKPVNVALIGVGRAGGIHLGNLVSSPSFRLLYVVESDKSKFVQIQSLAGSDCVVTEDLDKPLSDEMVEAVIICTPTYTHCKIVLQSLKAGKAVFCEKPIGESVEDTKLCYDTSTSTGNILFCAFQRRWDPTFADIQGRVRNGEAGHVQIIKSISRDSPLPSIEYLKISGGIFHDCMVHDIDMQTWVLGELPTQVHTMANAQIPEIAAIDDFDNVVTTLRYPSGTLGIINVNRFATYGYDQRLEVFGTKAMFEADNGRPNTCLTSSENHLSKVPIHHSFPSRYETAYASEMESFARIVREVEPLGITYKVSSAVSKIADAAEKSAREGKPIDLIWTNEELPSGYSAA